MTIRHRGFVTGAVTALVGLAFGGAVVVAQDAPASPGAGSPVATMAATGPVSHPAHIHTGTCDQLGDVVFPLSNVGVPASADGTPTAAGATAGAQDAIPAYVSVSQLNVSLDDILAAPHAINVHESEQNIQNYVACGNIGGVRYGDTIQFGLRELNGSGMTGVAAISGDQDGSSNVVLYVAPTGQ